MAASESYVNLAAMKATGAPAKSMRLGEREAAESRLYRTARVLWIVLAVAIAFYAAAALAVPPAGKAEKPGVERALFIFAAAYVAGSVGAKRWLETQAESLESLRLKRAGLILPLLLCQIAALTGLALRLVTGSTHYYWFLLLGFAGMVLNFPWRRR